MAQFPEFFKTETLFSRDNPLFKAAEKTHRLVFQTFDQAARLQLAFAADLLDMNRDRFESLYAKKTLSDIASAQQDLVVELGKRTARHLGELQDVAMAMTVHIGEAANELAPEEARPARAKKAKAA